MTCDRKTMLVIEDNLGDVEIIQRTFEKVDPSIRIEAVSSGAKAIQFLRGEGAYAEAPNIDMILLDLNLLQDNGHNTLRSLKSDPQLCTIPVVVLTSSGREYDIVESYRLGASSYLVKPCGLADFEKMVSAVASFWFRCASLPVHRNVQRHL